MRLFIPLICYNHNCYAEFMMSMLKLIPLLKEYEIDYELYPIFFESLISRARNAAVSNFLKNPENTHLLFIDSDIIFKAEDVLKLFVVDKDIIGCAYPLKKINLDKLKKSKNLDEKDAVLVSTEVGLHLKTEQYISTLMECDYMTTGFVLIKRNVFETLIEKYPEKEYVNDVSEYGDGKFYDLFSVSINPQTKILESEDYSFSRLWREAGGKIYVKTDINLQHIGGFSYFMNLYRKLTLEQN